MSIADQIKQAIETAIPESEAAVLGSGGHFEIDVVAGAFAGKRILEQQRLVYSAIAHLMSGDDAPLHAVDSMVCRTP
jgi:acid stress-induced BolA-like protein IbaG/YrbA